MRDSTTIGNGRPLGMSAGREGHRLRRVAMAFTLAIGLLVAALPAAANADIKPMSYVAMGDSYTAGPGITPVSPTAPPECGQSLANYPHLVAAALNLSLTDVSCSGAKTEDFTVSQFPGVPPQFDALSPSTEIVTIGMGGNDNNLFGTLVEKCTLLDIGKPNEGAPCREAEEGFVTETFEKTKGPQEEALREVHKLAPRAKVYLVAYPEITPINGYCPTAIPWTTEDLRWFHFQVQARGNANLALEALPAFLLDDCTEVNDEMLAGVQTVAVTAGASAPEHLVEELIANLRSRGFHHLEEAEIKEEDVRFTLPADLESFTPRLHVIA